MTQLKSCAHSKSIEVDSIRAFYIFLCVITVWLWDQLLVVLNHLHQAVWLWPWSLLPEPINGPTIPVALFITTLTLLIVTARAPQLALLRVVSAVCFYLCLTFVNSFGAVAHSEILWVIASIIFCAPWNYFAIGLGAIGAYTFSTYVNSGLWKLRYVTDWLVHNGSPQALTRVFSEHVATSYAEGSLAHRGVVEIVTGIDAKLKVVWFAVIALQLLFVIPIFRPAWSRAFALLAILFHVLTNLTMGVWYFHQVLFIAWLFFGVRRTDGGRTLEELA